MRSEPIRHGDIVDRFEATMANRSKHTEELREIAATLERDLPTAQADEIAGLERQTASIIRDAELRDRGFVCHVQPFEHAREPRIGPRDEHHESSVDECRLPGRISNLYGKNVSTP